jgi:hypothetical protein
MAVFAQSARADALVSSNWSGYAAHRRGVTFTQVSATWHQPRLRCRRGQRTFSAMWVGMGGFSANANALEQIGTEIDCKRSGRTTSGAWYELIPDGSHPVRIGVHPGDTIAAQVGAFGDRVSLQLSDLTRHTTFQRTIRARPLDVSSAEWILEAPSECYDNGSCQTLPLANFRTASFASAFARTADGHLGPILDPRWNHTRLLLLPDRGQFSTFRGARAAGGAATPSRLSSDGSSFNVKFSRASVGRRPVRRHGRRFASLAR